MGCPFCDINESEIVVKEKNVFCIVNIKPIKDIHVMVVPTRHVENLSELSPKESKDILYMIDRISKAISSQDINVPIIFMNTGNHSTQPHLHFHVLPSKGGIRELFSSHEKIPESIKMSEKELNQMASRIAKTLN